MSEKETNQDSLDSAINILKQVSINFSTPKAIRKNISDMMNGLVSASYSISVRAANAISELDEITQDPNLPSYIRVTLWQVVSALERIRE